MAMKRMHRLTTPFDRIKVATGLAIAITFALPSVHSQTAPETTQPAPAPPPKTRTLPQRYRTSQQAASAEQYYSMIWGVDSLSVKSGESGEIIRFA
jgi:hypothetical protein